MRGLKRTAAGLAAITLAAGVLAGCGSSGDTAAADTAAVESVASEVATTAALTKDEYVAQADAICSKIDDTMAALDSQDTESLAQVKDALAKATTAAEQGVAELKALVPPADLQAAHDAFIQSSADSITLFNKITSAVEAGNVDEAALTADAKEAATLAEKQEAAAQELGLTACFTDTSADDAG